MMNKMPTSKAGKLRLLIVLPLAITLLFAFRNATPTVNDFHKKESITTPELQDEKGELPSDHKAFLKRNPEVIELIWVPENFADDNSRIARVVIERKVNPQFENYHLDNRKDMAAFEMKYGELPKVPTRATQQNGDKGLPKELVKHLMQNPAIKSVKGKVVDNRNAIVIRLKGGGTEVYYLDDAKSIAELERKYNLPELPPPPPPAPAAPDAEELPPPPPPVRQEQNQLKAPAGVVYYIDGKEDKSEAYKNLDPKEIHSVNVYKGEGAQKVFGKSAANGVISIITTNNKDSRQVQEFMQKLPALPAPAKQELLPPPPPVKFEGPAIPTDKNVKIIDDEKGITYILRPENALDKSEFEAATNSFKRNGFDLSLKKTYTDNKLDKINITIASKKLNKGTSTTYTLADLAKYDNVVVVKGNKKTGEVMIVTTIPGL